MSLHVVELSFSSGFDSFRAHQTSRRVTFTIISHQARLNWLAVVACASVGSSVALVMGRIRSVVRVDGMVTADSVVRGVPEGEDDEDEDDEEQKEDEEEDEEDEEDQGEGYSE